MPELPEVERAVALLRSIGKGNKIIRVETSEDNIVFQGLPSHEDFGREISGRILRDVFRYGKCFYIELEGAGRMPVLHFGMTGMLQVRNQAPLQYMTRMQSSEVWPPKFMKVLYPAILHLPHISLLGQFIFHIEDKSSLTITELAFSDARRLGRIRLATHPREELPISRLGFDPIISMPSLTEFRTLVLRRSCPIKALLLDQSFSAGVGNYLADEILYQAKVHPEQRCNTLHETQVDALHREVADVCRIAVEANADVDKYPSHWLFKHRWGKGKKAQSMKLPLGEPATIKWITVGGRTSAYVAEVQCIPYKQSAGTEVATEDESDLTPFSSDYDGHPAASRRKRKRKSKTIGSSAPTEELLREKRPRLRKR
ncbi:AtMMH-1 [Rhizopogon vinicolor AM-OR11-026]|uniref:AtMMH-1 n=1 Tax=Rhizopogon vinicolor AM-OR11-026 TaxID=1314800 RepID=A0A1B7NFE6_9AGAM|nr:AtMMH-1 [Rhizopogon vinicolor AM-OR11-026]